MDLAPIRNLARQLQSPNSPRVTLAEVALAVIQARDPTFTFQHLDAMLHRLADGVRDHEAMACVTAMPPPGPEDDPHETLLGHLNAHLFKELGFSGDTEDYYDPRNSFLDAVIERRRGIPITLSILYIEVGVRLNLPLAGVSFPGHFLVRLGADGRETILDPYFGATVLTRNDLENRLEQMFGAQSITQQQLETMTRTASAHEVAVRLVRNLKGVYMHRDQLDEALWACQAILELMPGTPIELRDRGMVFEKMDAYRAAAQDFRAYLDSAPEAIDSSEIRSRLKRVDRLTQALN